MEVLTIIIYFMITLVSIFYLFFKIRYLYWKNRGVPYLEPKIPFGNLSSKKKHIIYIMEEFYNYLPKEKHQFIGGYFLFSPVAIITNLDLVKSVLIKDFNYFNDRGIYYNEKEDPLSAHLFNLDGEKWKSLRAKLTPTFTSGKMKFMFPTVVKVGYEFQKTLNEELENSSEEIEIKDLLARFTTDVIGTCAFGIECNSLKDPNTHFRVVGKTVFESTGQRGRVNRIILEEFKSLARLLGIRKNSESVHNFFMNVVKETVDLREKNNIRRNDFMDLLIELKNGKNDQFNKLTLGQIAAQAFVFFLAGFETSSTLMSFFLYELAYHQDIQERVRREIFDVLEKHKGEFTYEAMTEMSYLEKTINETLRKYPPGTVLQRKCVIDYKVPNTNLIIEKGRNTLIPVYAIHHDPEIYPDPEKFDPERFSPDAIKSRHPQSFLPFGDGPRNCIGLRFGMMQARIGLITLLRYFRFSPCSKTQNPFKFSTKSLVLSPEEAFILKIEKLQ